MELSYIHDLKSNGIVKIPNFLNEEETKKVKKILEFYSSPKSGEDTYFSCNIKSLLFRIIKFDFIKLKESIFFLNLAKKKKLNLIANEIFGRESHLRFIDGYYSKKSEKEIIPWHVDQAYQGDEKKSKNFVNPDHYFLKFFIYLTDVKSENGCTSYIPKSHKIAYALRKGIFKNKIEYQPYWSLQDFRKIISKKENITFLKNYLNDSNLIDDFLEKTKFIEENEEVHNFDFELPAGGAIIFDEGGVPKGSKTNTSDRIALRYLYSVKKYNY